MLELQLLYQEANYLVLAVPQRGIRKCNSSSPLLFLMEGNERPRVMCCAVTRALVALGSVKKWETLKFCMKLPAAFTSSAHYFL